MGITRYSSYYDNLDVMSNGTWVLYEDHTAIVDALNNEIDHWKHKYYDSIPVAVSVEKRS